MRSELGTFLQQYGRTSRRRNGHGPNDRGYDRRLEGRIKRLPPEELDLFIRGDDLDDGGAHDAPW